MANQDKTEPTLRPPTQEEKAAMAEMSTLAETAMRDSLKQWASTIYSIGFAAGVEKAMATTKATEGGLLVPIRPPLIVPGS